MRKSYLTIIALTWVLSCSKTALSFDPLGPPKAGHGQGQFSWGLEYLYGNMDVEAKPAFEGFGFTDMTLPRPPEECESQQMMDWGSVLAVVAIDTLNFHL